MPGPEPSRKRDRLLRMAAVAAALAAAAGALQLGGAFDAGDDEPQAARVGAPATRAQQPAEPPRVEEISAGDNPIAVAASEDQAWIADALEPTASRIEIPFRLPLRTSFSLAAPSTAVAVGEGGVWFALQREAIERRSLEDPAGDPRTIELDDHASAIEVGAGYVWALVPDGVDRIDPRTGEVADHYSAGGFATALAVTPGALWMVADNREVIRLDPETGERAGEPVEVADAASIAADERYAWVASSSGGVTRIDARSLAIVGEPANVPAAVDIAVGGGGVWVAAAGGSVARLDPRSGEPVGEPIRAGQGPTSISAGDGVVWVVNGGDATLTRIEP